MSGDLSDLVTALVALAVLALLMKWIFTPSHRSGGYGLIDASDSADLGLLRVIATNLPRATAMELRATLGEAGLRSSMSRRRDGTHDVLVFDADVARARELLN
jgi:hypothetical protein